MNTNQREVNKMKARIKEIILKTKPENILPLSIQNIRVGKKLVSTYIIELQLRLVAIM
jgi:hypothetical protein